MYDLIVIGGGTGGLTAARLVAQAGKRVALIERGRPGGDCLWTGCVPTKSLIHAAKVYHESRNSQRFGVSAEQVHLDFSAVRRHVIEAQRRAGQVETPEAIASWGVEFVPAEAKFVDAHTVEADGRSMRARSFVIATGSRPAIPPIPGLEEAGFDTNEELVEWDELPGSLAILGGGPIGVEFAQIMARFGVQVTLVEQAPRLLGGEDPAASAVVQRILRCEGVDVMCGSTARMVQRDNGSHTVEVEREGQAGQIRAERLVIATGRKPSIDGLDLDAAGVSATRNGVPVDASLRSSQPHIFAVGDVNGGPQFTHVAEDQGRTVARSILKGEGALRRPARWNSRVVPRVTFTDPEVASVGLTEAEARKQYRGGVRTWEVALDEVDRAVTMGKTDGFLKLVTAPGWWRRIPGASSRVGDEVVGACFVGPNAGDLLMPVVNAMRMRLPMGLIAWNMQAYPTLAAGVRQVAGMPFDPGR